MGGGYLLLPLSPLYNYISLYLTYHFHLIYVPSSENINVQIVIILVMVDLPERILHYHHYNKEKRDIIIIIINLKLFFTYFSIPFFLRSLYITNIITATTTISDTRKLTITPETIPTSSENRRSLSKIIYMWIWTYVCTQICMYNILKIINIYYIWSGVQKNLVFLQ